MKWRTTIPRDLDERVVTKFIWWPKRLDVGYTVFEETKWLGIAHIREVYFSGRWIELQWEDDG